MAQLSPDAVADALDVGPDALRRLRLYADLLADWNRRINLVGPDTIPDLWRRHILDSGQLCRVVPERAETILDLGSGAGLPGLIVAILADRPVHLLESDLRKCAFLREAARVTGAPVTIHATRIEQVPAMTADVVMSRALAPVAKLLDLAERFLTPATICLFLKGRRVEDELTAARESWQMEVATHPSLSDPSGSVIAITAAARSRSTGK